MCGCPISQARGLEIQVLNSIMSYYYTLQWSAVCDSTASFILSDRCFCIIGYKNVVFHLHCRSQSLVDNIILVLFKNIVSPLASFFHFFHCLFSMTGSRKIFQGSWLGHGHFQPWELGDFLCKCMD